MIKEFMGSQKNADFLGASSFTLATRQLCKNLFISMSFQDKSLSWREIVGTEFSHNAIGPSYYPTDFGACCLFVPHNDFEGFDPAKENITYAEKYHNLIATARNGESNGLRQGSLHTQYVFF